MGAVVKTCTKCGEAKPLEEFYADKRATDGRISRCKPCHNEANRASRGKNPEPSRASARRYKAKNRDAVLEQTRQWKALNVEHRRAYQRAYSATNKDAVGVYNRAYYEKNREGLLTRAAEYRETYPERRRASRDPKKSRIYNQRRRALKLGAFVEDVYEDVVIARDKNRCGICSGLVHELLEIDHIFPLSRGGKHSYANVQVTHRTCNRKKWTKTDYSA